MGINYSVRNNYINTDGESIKEWKEVSYYGHKTADEYYKDLSWTWKTFGNEDIVIENGKLRNVQNTEGLKNIPEWLKDDLDEVYIDEYTLKNRREGIKDFPSEIRDDLLDEVDKIFDEENKEIKDSNRWMYKF